MLPRYVLPCGALALLLSSCLPTQIASGPVVEAKKQASLGKSEF